MVVAVSGIKFAMSNSNDAATVGKRIPASPAAHETMSPVRFLPVRCVETPPNKKGAQFQPCCAPRHLGLSARVLAARTATLLAPVEFHFDVFSVIIEG